QNLGSKILCGGLWSVRKCHGNPRKSNTFTFRTLYKLKSFQVIGSLQLVFQEFDHLSTHLPVDIAVSHISVSSIITASQNNRNTTSNQLADEIAFLSPKRHQTKLRSISLSKSSTNRKMHARKMHARKVHAQK